MGKEQLNEDIGFSSDATKLRLKDNLSKGGSRFEVPENRLVLRRPKKEEIQAAGMNPADYQIAELRIFSKILYDFGLVSKVFRSKKSPIVKSNIKKVEKYKNIFKTFLSKFNAEEPISHVRKALELVKDKNFEAADFVGILRSTKNWNSEEELLKNLAGGLREIKNYKEDTDPSEKDVEAVKNAYTKLSDYIHEETKEGHTEKEITDSILYANTINNIMEVPYMVDGKKLLYKDTEIKNPTDLEAEMRVYLDSQQTEGKTGHSNTILHDEARQKLQELALKMKKDGYTGGLTTTNVLDYLDSNEPNILDYISTVYNIDREKLNGETFPTWESLAKFFYSPENLNKIVEMIGVKERPKELGQIRKGAVLTVDAKLLKKRKEKLENRIKNAEEEKTVLNELQDKLDIKQKEYEEAKEIRDSIEADLVEAKQTNKPEVVITKLETSFEQAKNLLAKIGKSVSAIKFAIKKEEENPTKRTSKQTYIETLRELEKQEKAVFDRARNFLDDTSDIRELEDMIDKDYRTEEQQKKKKDDFDLSEIKYYTWSFVINSTNREVINTILTELKSGLKLFSDYDYMNIDAYNPEYTEMRGTQIIVDYPKESNLYKLLAKKPKFAYEMMDSLVNTAKNRLNANVSYYTDEDYIKINQQF